MVGYHIEQHRYRLCIWNIFPAFLPQIHKRVSFRRTKYSGSSQYFWSSSGLRTEWSSNKVPSKVVQALLFIFHSKGLAEFRTQSIKIRLISQDFQWECQITHEIASTHEVHSQIYQMRMKTERQRNRIRQNNTNKSFV